MRLALILLAVVPYLHATCRAQSAVEFGTAGFVHAATTMNTFFLSAQILGSPTPEIIDWEFATPLLRIWNLDVNPNSSTPTLVLNVGPTIHDVQVGDVDGDGDQDIVATTQSQTLRVFFNSNGSFTSITLPTLVAGRAIIRDVDGDGLPDITAGINVYRGQSGPTFVSLPVPIPVDPTFREMLPADIDGDGDVDFVSVTVTITTTGTSALEAYVIRRNGPGSYTILPKMTLAPEAGLYRGDIVDIEQDGRDELIVTTGVAQRPFTDIRVFDGSPAAALVARQTIRLPPSTRFGQMVFRNVDADGLIDIVATIGDQNDGFGSHYAPVILLNDGNGQFVPHQGLGSSLSFGSHLLGTSLAVGHFDADQLLDVIMVTGAFPSPTGGGMITAMLKASAVTPTAIPPASMSIVPGSVLLLPQISPVLMGPNQTGVQRFKLEANTPAGPVPLRGIWNSAVISNLSSSATINGGVSVIAPTTGNGIAHIGIRSGPQLGRFSVTATAMSGIIASATASTAVGGQVLSSSGQNQVAHVTTTFANPLEVIVGDIFGTPVGGAILQFSYTVPTQNVVTISPGPIMADGTGRATVTVTATQNTGSATVEIGSSVIGPNVMFPLTVIPSQLHPFSGGGQTATLGSSFSQPIVVRALAAPGMPILNLPVTFSSSGVSFVSPTTVMTDAGGFASVQIVGTVLGTQNIVAQSPVGSTSTSVFNRGLSRVITPSLVFLTYRHEHASVPLILAVDAPQPTPVATPFGLIHTSILAPSPSLFLIDGLGVFGPLNPSGVTAANGNYSILGSVGSTPLGITLVAQVYAYDTLYSYPDNIIVSNPVTLNL